MKSLRILLVLALGLMLTVGVVACGDSGSGNDINTSATASDFVGTWSGNLTFTVIADPNDSDNGASLLTFTLTENAGSVSGTFSDDNISGTVSSGVYNFTITSTSTHPDCDNFNVSGTGTLNTTKNSMTFNASGMFCGKDATLTGTLTKQ